MDKLERERGGETETRTGRDSELMFPHIDQSEVVFIYGKLFRSNLLLQSGGIGALREVETETETETETERINIVYPT